MTTQTSNLQPPTSKKVAIVCEWITGVGGAERVILELHKLFPDAPIYTSQYDPSKVDWFDGLDIRTGWLQKLPSGLKKFLPVLRAWYFSHLDLSDYDLVISAGGSEAKFVKVKSPAKHIAYIHAPTHYYWSRYNEYMKHPGFGAFDWLARLGLRILVGPMRRWDHRAAQRPGNIIANSTHIQKEIKKYYGRESTVIFPPVNLERFSKYATNKDRDGFVINGRQTPYKRTDLAVAACTELGLPLKVLGDGPQHQELLSIAGPTISFQAKTTDQDINEAISSAKAFLFPGLDDFGIAPVEALAAGTPVIAFKGGGALDYIQDGKNGKFFDKQRTENLVSVLKDFHVSYSTTEIAKTTQEFSETNFAKRIKKFLSNC